MKKFWNWIRDDGGGRVLRLEGPIDEDQLWGDEITPQMFREELYSEEGDLTLWINSPGGNVFCAAEMFSMIRDYPYKVTVKIDAIAASAASVVAMAGDEVLMSPCAMLMIHDPSTVAMGNKKDMEHAIDVLNSVKESIISAYALKTKLRRSKISELMENETWMYAQQAVDLGFADGILFSEKPEEEKSTDDPDEEKKEQTAEESEPVKEQANQPAEEEKPEQKAVKLSVKRPAYSARRMDLAVLARLKEKEAKEPEKEKPPEENKEPDVPVIGLDGKTKDGSVPYGILMDKLECLR